jgi:hypothetical protein
VFEPNVTTTTTTDHDHGGSGGAATAPAHPLAEQLPAELQSTSSNLTQDLQLWAACYERWILTLSEVPQSQWWRYLGRCANLQWCQADVCDVRDGPVSSVSVPPNLNLAGRAAATCVKVVSQALANRSSKRWSTALCSLLTSQHDSLWALRAALGTDKYNKAFSELGTLAGWMSGAIEEPPAHLCNKWIAYQNTVSRSLVEDGKQAKLKWIESLFEQGASRGHKWAAAPLRAANAGDSLTEAEAHLESQLEKFASLWKVDDPGYQDAFLQAFLQLSDHAIQEGHLDRWLANNSDRFSPANIRRALWRFKARTSTGTDWVHLHQLRLAPDEVLEALGGILQQFVTHLVGPNLEVPVILDLIPKKTLPGASPDFRSTATFASHWRILTSIMYADFEESDRVQAFEFDSALKGRSPTRMLLRRNVLAAIARAAGFHHGLVLWDITGFFESCQPNEIVRATKAGHLPAVATAISTFGHAQRRVMRWRNLFSRLISPRSSIATGCHTSPSFARGILKQPLQKVVDEATRIEKEGKVKLTMLVHVDDFATEATGTVAMVEDALYRTGVVFRNATNAAGFSISAKSIILASSRQLAVRLRKRFELLGLKVQVQAAGDHLGVNRTFTKNKTFVGLNKRFKKAAIRNRRVAWLSRFAYRASRLYKTGTVPSAAYSSSVIGLNKSLQDKLDALALKACTTTGFGHCATTTVFLQLGHLPSVDKLVTFMKEFIHTWLELDAEERIGAARAWDVQLTDRASKQRLSNWQHVGDSIGAAIAVLVQAGWQPMRPDKWKLPDGTPLPSISEGPVIRATVLEQLRQALMQKKWDEAAFHLDGDGLQQGQPAFDGVKQARRFLQRLDRHDMVCHLDRVVSGGSTAGCRFDHNRQCLLCGTALDTPRHRLECPALPRHCGEDDLVRKWVDKTAWVPKKASFEHHQPAVLWQRGILPFDWGLGMCRRQPSDVHRFETSCGDASFQDIYTDGAGPPGCEDIPTICTSVGAAAVALNWTQDEQDIQGCAVSMASVAGGQTVPRAETAAVSLAAQIAEQHGQQSEWKLHTDAMYVVKGMAQLQHTPPNLTPAVLNGTNGDLWLQVQEQCFQQPEVHKVKAHMTIDDVSQGKLHFTQYVGNAVADVASKAASQQAKLPEVVRRVASFHLATSFSISMRIAATEAVYKLARDTNTTWQVITASSALSSREAATLQQRAIEQAGHQLHSTSKGKLRCARCGLVKGLHEWGQWMQPCMGADQWASGPMPQPTRIDKRQGIAGNASQPLGVIWEDHRVVSYRGAFRCTICGACGPLDSLGQCEQQVSQSARCLEPFEGTFTQMCKRQKYEKQLQKQADASSSRASTDAASMLARQVAAVQPEVADDTLPPWHLRVHRSHQAYVCAGMMFCSKCGSVATVARSRSRMFEMCPASTNANWKLPEGSRGRLNRALVGLHPDMATLKVQGSTWPNGKPANAQQRAYKVQWEEAAASVVAIPAGELFVERASLTVVWPEPHVIFCTWEFIAEAIITQDGPWTFSLQSFQQLDGDHQAVANAIWILLNVTRTHDWIVEHTGAEYYDLTTNLDEVSLQLRGSAISCKPPPPELTKAKERYEALLEVSLAAWFNVHCPEQEVADGSDVARATTAQQDEEWFQSWFSQAVDSIHVAIDTASSFAKELWLPWGAALWARTSRSRMSLLTNAAEERCDELIRLLELHGQTVQHPVTAFLRTLEADWTVPQYLFQEWVAKYGQATVASLVVNFVHQEVPSQITAHRLAELVVESTAGVCSSQVDTPQGGDSGRVRPAAVHPLGGAVPS